MRYIDMHVHTTASDGTLTPTELVEYAIKNQLSGVAITDHDTVEGIEEAKTAAGYHKDFIVIPGIELSSFFNNEEVHILGYKIDYKSDMLINVLDKLKNSRITRAVEIIKKLNKFGFDILFSDVEEISKGGVIGRPHIAKVLTQKGYVKDSDEAFRKYLIRGCPAYVSRYKLSVEGAIDTIKKVGGIPVVAHPGRLSSIQIVNDLINKGIEGIEVYHPDHTEKQSSQYLHLAKKNNLLITGGSDFHYPPVEYNYSCDMGNIRISLDSIKHILQNS